MIFFCGLLLWGVLAYPAQAEQNHLQTWFQQERVAFDLPPVPCQGVAGECDTFVMGAVWKKGDLGGKAAFGLECVVLDIFSLAVLEFQNPACFSYAC